MYITLSLITVIRDRPYCEACRKGLLLNSTQIPKFGIVLVVVLVLGALGFRKETDVIAR